MGLINCRPSNNNRVVNNYNSDEETFDSLKFNFNNNPNNDKLFMESIKYEIKESNKNFEDYIKFDVKFYIETLYYDEEIIITNIHNKPYDFSIIFKKYINFDFLETIPRDLCKEDECTICLNKLKDIPKGICIPVKLKCGHKFHYNCIGNWHKYNQTCPICRKSVNLILNNN